MENDYELIYSYRMGSEEATERLISKYHLIIWSIIHNFNIQYYESDLDDIYQLCMVELFKCINRYCESNRASFKTYFYQCAKTCILNYLSYENNKSLLQIRVAVSIDNCVCEDSNTYLEETIVNPNQTSHDLLMLDLDYLENQVLTKCNFSENKIWHLRKMGYTYEEIALQCDVSIKKVDNSIRKINRLLKNYG